MKIYVASSWKNPMLNEVISSLRKSGHYVYDFRETGFSWLKQPHLWAPSREVNKPSFYKAANDGAVRAALSADLQAFNAADAVVAVLPCGRSSHIEIGMAITRGIPVIMHHGMSDEDNIDLMHFHSSIMHTWNSLELEEEVNRAANRME